MLGESPWTEEPGGLQSIAGKANQLGEPTAIKLLENCSAVYDVAKENGWADQYMRNRTLIDLSMVPQNVKDVITEAISVPEPEVPDDRPMVQRYRAATTASDTIRYSSMRAGLLRRYL